MWWKSSEASRTPKRRETRRFRPTVEVLEGRLLLAAYYWTGNSDGNPQWWSKGYNWANAMGVHYAENSPPGPLDDVFLDAGSNGIGNNIVDQAFAGTIADLTIGGFTQKLLLARNLTVTGAKPSGIAGGTIDAASGSNTITISGTLTLSGGTITGGQAIAAGGSSTTTVSGTFTLDNGILRNGGTLTDAQGGQLDVKNGGSITNSVQFNLTGGTVTNSAGAGTFTNLGTLALASALTIGTFVNKGTFNLNAGGTATFTSSATQQDIAGANTVFNGGSMTAQGSVGYDVKMGTLTGSAAGSTITGNLTNDGGTIDCGGTTGTLTVTGNFTQNSGTLSIGVDFTNKTNSKLAVGGTATLGDTLSVNFNGTLVSQAWTIITFNQKAGDFANLKTNGPRYTKVQNPPRGTYQIQT